MTGPYYLNSFMATPPWGGRPDGLVDARIKTPFVMSEFVRSNSKLHRPRVAYAYRADGRLLLAARYACGAASTRAMPVPDLDQIARCERCEEVTSRPAEWSVYAFFDAEGRALYVGQTNNLTIRRRTHELSAAWWPAVEETRVLSYATSRATALASEAKAIRELRPLYNVIHNGKQVAS